MTEQTTHLSKAAIRALLSSEAANLRVLTHEIDDREFQGASFAASRVVGELRRIARDLEDLRADVAALEEKEQTA
ncbi:MAG: hypothetical protein HY508_10855 [Acidobacteria bacterium]|nr:hypothetical protein [Acidobacteriota bacterium]